MVATFTLEKRIREKERELEEITRTQKALYDAMMAQDNDAVTQTLFEMIKDKRNEALSLSFNIMLMKHELAGVSAA